MINARILIFIKETHIARLIKSAALLFVGARNTKAEIRRVLTVGKGKPRHNPDKPQNKIGAVCPWYEEFKDGSGKTMIKNCEGWMSTKAAEICDGNPHNCIKVKYRYLAARSDKQKNNDYNKLHYFGM